MMDGGIIRAASGDGEIVSPVVSGEVSILHPEAVLDDTTLHRLIDDLIVPALVEAFLQAWTSPAAPD